MLNCGCTDADAFHINSLPHTLVIFSGMEGELTFDFITQTQSELNVINAATDPQLPNFFKCGMRMHPTT